MSLAEQAWRDGYVAGFWSGHEVGHGQAEHELLELASEEKRLRLGILNALSAAAPPAERWHVCCKRCRLSGHRGGCRSCENRTRETFGQPHADDYCGDAA
jgi:hypothetical protein